MPSWFERALRVRAVWLLLMVTSTPGRAPSGPSMVARMLALGPRRMFLTHYGPVENPQILAPDLLGRIRAHAALARAQAGDSVEALAERLGEALFAEYQSAGGRHSARRFGAILEMDLRLNAQGLRHWLAHGD